MSSEANWNGAPKRVRWSLGAALLVAAASHLPVIPMHLREAPYLGWGFVAFVLAATVVAGGVVINGSRRWFLAAAALCTAAIAAYCATRLVAFPQLADDLGNWSEPAGVAAMLSELAAVALAQAGLNAPVSRAHRTRRVSLRLAAGSALVLGLGSTVTLPAAAGTASMAAMGTATATGTPKLAKFTEQLTVPPALDLTAGGAVTLSMRGGAHRFAAALPDTPTLGYAVGGSSGTDVFGGPTLVARRGNPVTVTVSNDLGPTRSPARWTTP